MITKKRKKRAGLKKKKRMVRRPTVMAKEGCNCTFSGCKTVVEKGY